MDQDPKHILVVDDDPDMVAIAQLALSDIGGLPTASADTTVSALSKGAEVGADLVLMDLRLGAEDGLEAWRHLVQTLGPAVRVIFVTAARAEETQALAGEPGYLGVISKPFDPMGLAGEVRALWANRP